MAHDRAVIPNQLVAVAGGVLGLALAAWCFYDAYEARDERRPFLVRWGGI